MLVAPIVPALGGNGLAMRAGSVLEALAGCADVDLVVVPVSGPLAGTEWAKRTARSLTAVRPVADAAAAREHLTRALADPLLRERLAASAPLPERARLAPPTLATELLAQLPRAPRAVFVLRGYLAPLGAALARGLGAKRLIVDLDDDDEAFARAAGAGDEADAIARLARAWLPDADVVCAAAAHEAEAIAARYGLGAVAVLPNAIRPPARTTPPPGTRRLLFVGNLTYDPNRDAAQLLAREILPLVRERCPDASLDLVGPHAGALGPFPGAHVRGRVDDVAPWYAGADIVVAPLRHAAGTRIKVLEAFAHRRPVVATGAAVAGLGVRDGHEVALGETAAELAGRVVELLGDPRRAAALIDAAAALVGARYRQEVVAAQVVALATGEPAP